MKLTENNLRKKLGVTDETIISIVGEFRKKLPLLNEDGEGFCINARDLHRELVVNDTSKTYKGKESKGDRFSQWIQRKIIKYEFQKGIDFETFYSVPKNVNAHAEEEIAQMSPQRRSAYGITEEYKLTIRMAKELSMLENNEIGKLARRCFIAIEDVLKLAMKWEKIRQPEKERYKQMCEELKKYFLRNFDKEPEWYQYSNEADTLNKICLGDSAKRIKEYIEAKDENTRDWLNARYNEYLDQAQLLNIMYLRMNFDKDRRYDLIRQGFKALYPNACFIMALK